MRNRYPGPCYRCGETVEKGAGHFEKIPRKDRRPGDPKWRTQHALCAIQARECLDHEFVQVTMVPALPGVCGFKREGGTYCGLRDYLHRKKEDMEDLAARVEQAQKGLG